MTEEDKIKRLERAIKKARKQNSPERYTQDDTLIIVLPIDDIWREG